jgi:hypothetical protein
MSAAEGMGRVIAVLVVGMIVFIGVTFYSRRPAVLQRAPAGLKPGLEAMKRPAPPIDQERAIEDYRRRVQQSAGGGRTGR